MATNKWLEGLKVLENKKENLKTYLESNSIYVAKTDTLNSLIDKAVSLGYKANNNFDENQYYDPLWRFPDPKGSDQLKTIREIYDEDDLASSYTYRAIVMISNDLDSFDLKAIMGSRTKADTFITSDGSTYTDITDATLIHTWNKDLDRLDSSGTGIRYLKIYTNQPYNKTPGIFGQLIWGIFNLHSQSSGISNDEVFMGTTNQTPIKDTAVGYRLEYCNKCKIIELENCNFKGNSVNNSNYSYRVCSTIGNPKLLKLNNMVVGSANQSYYSFPGIDNIETIYCSISPTLTSFALQWKDSELGHTSSFLRIKNLILDISTQNAVTEVKFAIPQCLTDLNFLYKFDKLQTLYLHKGLNITQLSIPDTVTKAYLYYMPNIHKLDLSSNENLTSLTLTGLGKLEKIILAENVSSISISCCYALKDIVVPFNFNTALNVNGICELYHDSIVAILNNLADLSDSSAKTLTLGATNLAKLTDEEKAIATNKNWTLA